MEKRGYTKRFTAVSCRQATYVKVKKIAKRFKVPAWRVVQQAINEYDEALQANER